MKKSRKLVLHRETLHAMDLRGVAGGYTNTLATRACSDPCIQSRRCDDGTYNGCLNTYENCSNGCTSGGACTLEGSCPTSG